MGTEIMGGGGDFIPSNRPAKSERPSILEQLAHRGGCIVSSNDCSELEIADAKVRGDFYVDRNGFGYVIRSKEWLDRVHARDGYMQPKPDPRHPVEGEQKRDIDLS